MINFILANNIMKMDNHAKYGPHLQSGLKKINVQENWWWIQNKANNSSELKYMVSSTMKKGTTLWNG